MKRKKAEPLPEVEMPDPGELPVGWRYVTILNACEVNPPKPSKDFLPSDAPVTFVPMPAVDADKGEITNPEIKPYLAVRNGFTSFRDGDVIMAKITPCMENGKAAIIRGMTNGIGFGSTEFHVMRSRGDILPEYLYYYIRQVSFRKEAENHFTGSVGQKRVPADFIKQSIIPLPTLAEQQRIVARVKVLLAHVNATRKRLNRMPLIMKRFRQGVLVVGCSGRLTEGWREGNPDIEPANELISKILNERKFWYNSEVNKTKIEGKRKPKKPKLIRKDATSEELFTDLPISWDTVFFEDIAANVENAIKAGPFGSSLTKSCYQKSGYKIYGQEQVIRGDATYGDYWISEEKFRELESCKIRPGDMLISLVGTIGKVLILPQDCKPGIINPRLMKLSLDQRIEKQYIQIFLESPLSKNRLFGDSHGGTMEILNLEIIKNIPIPLPPLAEQHEIVRRVNALFARADAIEREAAAATKRGHHNVDN